MRSSPKAVRRAAMLFFVFGVGLHGESSFYVARVAPIFDRHCTVCHGAEKQKAKLRLDAFEHVMRGSESGAVLKSGDPKGSELFRRITLKPDDEDVMPSDGKPLLSSDEIKVIELWIAADASATKLSADFPAAPAVKALAPATIPLAPDWHPRAAEIAALEKSTGLRLLPRSQLATDGIVVRTASAPSRCDDAALARLAPIADLIVEAELARTRITDAALKSVARWPNLRSLDLTQTAITSAGLSEITGITKLASLNLTDTGVDESGAIRVRALPSLQHLWLFGTKAAEAGSSAPRSTTN
ncbi:MAG: c-type cytochrome domain-containing protein [Opitutaceae bacterium]